MNCSFLPLLFKSALLMEFFNLHSLCTCFHMGQQDTLNWSEAALQVCTLVVLSRCIVLFFSLPRMLKAFSLDTQWQFPLNFHYALLDVLK